MLQKWKVYCMNENIFNRTQTVYVTAMSCNTASGTGSGTGSGIALGWRNRVVRQTRQRQESWTSVASLAWPLYISLCDLLLTLEHGSNKVMWKKHGPARVPNYLWGLSGALPRLIALHAAIVAVAAAALQHSGLWMNPKSASQTHRTSFTRCLFHAEYRRTDIRLDDIIFRQLK